MDEDRTMSGSTRTAGRNPAETQPDEDALRRDMDDSRRRISETVTQIEDRVRPGNVVARRRERIRRRLTDWKDTVFGNDEPDYPRYSVDGGTSASPATTRYDDEQDDGMLERVRERSTDGMHAVREAPRAARRRTQGNPLAAGAVALGAGWLLGSVLPDSRRERELAARAEPAIGRAAAELRDEASDVARSVQGEARQAAEHVKEAGRDAADDMSRRGQEAASSVRDRS